MKPATHLSADYVIAGAGATGLAFADTLLSESDATIVIVDRRAKPGGHWNDAYPFVRLHGPAVMYGVNSLPLGTGRIDDVGLNRGLHELASGDEIRAYFDRVLHERLLPSGRVTYLPLNSLDADGVATPLLGGTPRRLTARRRWVEATLADTQTPATHPPRFAVHEGVQCVTPTALARAPMPCSGHVVIGGGKTAMDTVLWLLAQGIEPDSITWIRPRDAWLMNRAHFQPTQTFGTQTLAAMAVEMELTCQATSLDDLFERLEAATLLQRIDPAVRPTMFRCAIVSDAELAQLRRVRRVVRMGRVRAIERHRIVLDDGVIPTSPQHVHVHCTTAGLPRGPAQPVFQGERILAQYVRRCSPSFSAAFIAYVEATVDDEAQKNALCEPVVIPNVPMDWLRMHLQGARNQQQWMQNADLCAWLQRSRLDAYSGLLAQAMAAPESASGALVKRLRRAKGPALQRMAEWLQAPALA